jgi:hypothetical protein
MESVDWFVHFEGVDGNRAGAGLANPASVIPYLALSVVD